VCDERRAAEDEQQRKPSVRRRDAGERFSEREAERSGEQRRAAEAKRFDAREARPEASFACGGVFGLSTGFRSGNTRVLLPQQAAHPWSTTLSRCGDGGQHFLAGFRLRDQSLRPESVGRDHPQVNSIGVCTSG